MEIKGISLSGWKCGDPCSHAGRFVIFRNIGYFDQLGSGVRKLFKYTKFYSGQEPELIEGDIFRIMIPLDSEYSFDYEIANKTTDKTTDKPYEDGIRYAITRSTPDFRYFLAISSSS